MRRFDLEANASENPANPFIIFPTADSSERTRHGFPASKHNTLSFLSLSLSLSFSPLLCPLYQLRCILFVSCSALAGKSHYHKHRTGFWLSALSPFIPGRGFIPQHVKTQLHLQSLSSADLLKPLRRVWEAFSVHPVQLKSAVGCFVVVGQQRQKASKRKQHNLTAISCCVSCLIQVLF